MLSLESVDVSYGHVDALSGVSIEVHDGELVTLLGANGAGKTSALMTISGIVRPRGGAVRYGGTDLTRMSAFEIVGLGVIQCPEGRRIFGGLSVLENLRMGAVRRAGRSGVSEDLEFVFSLFPVLDQRRGQSGATLSGGEQQMLAIGRALMAAPRLLLLDEPSLGLAPIVVQSIFRVIRELHRRGVTILLVEQNVTRTLAVTDRGYVLEHGKIELSGKSSDLAYNAHVRKVFLGV